MSLSIRPVETTFVQQVWPFVEGYLQSALEKDGTCTDYNIHHVQMFLTSGQWLLLVAADEDNAVHGAATVSFINYPLSRVAFITAIGGKLISNDETFEQLKALLKQRGATKIQGFGREAIVRLWKRYNFEPRNTLVEVTL
jgi:hypothetical protein